MYVLTSDGNLSNGIYFHKLNEKLKEIVTKIFKEKIKAFQDFRLEDGKLIFVNVNKDAVHDNYVKLINGKGNIEYQYEESEQEVKTELTEKASEDKQEVTENAEVEADVQTELKVKEEKSRTSSKASQNRGRGRKKNSGK